MTDYIINPMWFYWLGLVDTLRLLVIAGTPAVCLVVIAVNSYLIEEDNLSIETFRKRVIFTFIIGALLTIIGIFIPSKETLIQMKLAETATKSNAEMILDAINDKTDKIIDALGKGASNAKPTE